MYVEDPSIFWKNALVPEKNHLITVVNTDHTGGNIFQVIGVKCKLLDFFDKNYLYKFKYKMSFKPKKN